MEHVLSQGHPQPAPPLLQGTGHGWSPEQLCLSEGTVPERGIELGRGSPEQLLLCAALCAEGCAWRGRRDGRSSSLGFTPPGQLHMAHAHLLPAETSFPFPPLPSLPEGAVHWSCQHPEDDLVSPFRQGPKFPDVVPAGRQHDP